MCSSKNRQFNENSVWQILNLFLKKNLKLEFSLSARIFREFFVWFLSTFSFPSQIWKRKEDDVERIHHSRQSKDIRIRACNPLSLSYIFFLHEISLDRIRISRIWLAFVDLWLAGSFSSRSGHCEILRLGFAFLKTFSISFLIWFNEGSPHVPFWWFLVVETVLQTFPPSEPQGKITSGYRPPRDEDGMCVSTFLLILFVVSYIG